MRTWTLMLTAVVLASSVNAALAQVTTKTIGATFIEAPPSRDKNLLPFGMMNAQEKVEVHIVATFPKHLVTDVPTFSSDNAVLATAVFKDKASTPLGNAEQNGFSRVSEDRRSALLTFSISRLPDKPVAHVEFAGTAKMKVAAQLRNVTVNFEPRVGAVIAIGTSKATVGAVKANEVTFKGDAVLSTIAGMKLIGAGGATNKGERSSYSLMNGAGEVTWRFDNPVVAGKLQLSLYDGMQTVEVPIRATVLKPY